MNYFLNPYDLILLINNFKSSFYDIVFDVENDNVKIKCLYCIKTKKYKFIIHSSKVSLKDCYNFIEDSSNSKIQIIDDLENMIKHSENTLSLDDNLILQRNLFNIL